ncbi:MAG: hypothetical protein DRP50_05040, partial [Thermotoga sp.]
MLFTIGSTLLVMALPIQWVQQRLIISQSNVKGVSFLVPKRASFYSNTRNLNLKIQAYKKGYVYVFTVLPNGRTYLLYPSKREMGRKESGVLSIAPNNGNYRFGMNTKGLVLMETIVSIRPILTLDHLIKRLPNNEFIAYMCDSLNRRKLYYNILKEL